MIMLNELSTQGREMLTYPCRDVLNKLFVLEDCMSKECLNSILTLSLITLH